MSDFETSKTLSAIGSILLWVPFASIVGYILLYVGIKGLSEHYRDDSIVRDFIIGVVFGIIGSIASAIGLVTALFGGIGTILSLASLSYLGSYATAALISSLLWAIVPLIVGFIFLLLQALRFKKGFNTLAQHSGVTLFRTTGTFLLIGAVLSIIYIGVIFSAIAYILMAVAFFSLKANPNSNPNPSPYGYTPTPPAQPQPTTSATNAKSNFCPVCGTPVSPGAAFCAHCGKQI
ncbi:MAG: DUF996 domain-containing protein [Nitrososphaerota archaeon]|jgi:uncharacterized membrane protein|uniref:DUF996 domain-containing protein n=1 Tax=Candidatus Bathycorpusculum sp. TaxID=2994959 RepID=UPI00282676F9|nr:DUF996 domain-containing protein [Candidatus Termitimicrobium sp.]MCL2431984.1 DUF996 domain-containing protein [Candidatus Termitimicrobium sp.]MDR0492593.1 DUF996 domain-containing protein [Nitrososphaerota archaeon]